MAYYCDIEALKPGLKLVDILLTLKSYIYCDNFLLNEMIESL